MGVSQKDKEDLLSLVFSSVEEDVAQQLGLLLESFSETDRAFLMGYLEGYADAHAVVQRAMHDMQP